MHKKKIISAGKKITEANKALIMLHGRGGSAEDILSLAAHLNIPGFALLAPPFQRACSIEVNDDKSTLGSGFVSSGA